MKLKRCPCFSHGPMFVCFSVFGRYSMNVITGCLFGVNMDPEPLIQFASKMLRISPLMFTIQGRNLIFLSFFLHENSSLSSITFIGLLYLPSLLPSGKACL